MPQEAGFFGPVEGGRRPLDSDAIKPLMQLRISKKIMAARVRPARPIPERLLCPCATALERYRPSSGDHQSALIVLKLALRKGPMPA